MASPQLLKRYVPGHFNDPVGLAVRLLRTGDPAAWFARAAAAAGVAAAPLDALLQRAERRYLESPAQAKLPLLFICGPPRSGTTVVYQTLVNHLPVAYLSNLTALFPRSPLTAQRLLGRFLRRPDSTARSYYGRTAGLNGTNDALYIWDRWLGADRRRPPQSLSADAQSDMRRFFAACGRLFGHALVNKNNNLNASAHLVAQCLPEAHFICLARNRRDLAQSLYRARCDIHGAPDQPYGLDANCGLTANPVRSVCEQVAWFERLAIEQRQRIGEKRFWIVQYEDFCRDPSDLVRRVANEVLGDARCVREPLAAAYRIPSRDKVAADIAARIDAELARLPPA
jgi:hypothetical protein